MSTYNLNTGLGRLKQLRDDLAALNEMEKKPVRFNMTVWKDERNLCGTSACAVGYCAMQPWAQKQGLELDEITLDPDMSSKWLVPTYEGLKSFEAVAEFFDLTEGHMEYGDLAYYLFDSGSYESDDDDAASPTIEDVLVRLDEVIEKKEFRG